LLTTELDRTPSGITEAHEVKSRKIDSQDIDDKSISTAPNLKQSFGIVTHFAIRWFVHKGKPGQTADDVAIRDAPTLFVNSAIIDQNRKN
jgi:hypothetical protein